MPGARPPSENENHTPAERQSYGARPPRANRPAPAMRLHSGRRTPADYGWAGVRAGSQVRGLGEKTLSRGARMAQCPGQSTYSDVRRPRGSPGDDVALSRKQPASPQSARAAAGSGTFPGAGPPVRYGYPLRYLASIRVLSVRRWRGPCRFFGAIVWQALFLLPLAFTSRPSLAERSSSQWSSTPRTRLLAVRLRSQPDRPSNQALQLTGE